MSNTPYTQSIPTYEQNIHTGGKTSSVWYRFFQGMYQGKPPALESALSTTASPFTFTATQRGFVIVQGGTVSLVQFSRGGVTNHTTGATQGSFPLSAGDSLIVTYSVAPSLVFVPQ